MTSKQVLPPTNDDTNPQQGNNNYAPDPKVETLDAGNERLAPIDVGNTVSSATSSEREYVKPSSTKKDLRKIFVGGIASTVTGNDFLKFFQQFGTVVDSVVMFDKVTGRSRGFGFVTFEEPSVAQTVLNKSKNNPGLMKIRGKVCELKAAEPKSSMQNARIEHGFSRLPNTGRGVRNVSKSYMPHQQTSVAQTSHPEPRHHNNYHDAYNAGWMAPSLPHSAQFAPPYYGYPEYYGFPSSPEYSLPYNAHYPAYAHGHNAMGYFPAGSHGYCGVAAPVFHGAPPGSVAGQHLVQMPGPPYSATVPNIGECPYTHLNMLMEGVVVNMDAPPGENDLRDVHGDAEQSNIV